MVRWCRMQKQCAGRGNESPPHPPRAGARVPSLSPRYSALFTAPPAGGEGVRRAVRSASHRLLRHRRLIAADGGALHEALVFLGVRVEAPIRNARVFPPLTTPPAP